MRLPPLETSETHFGSLYFDVIISLEQKLHFKILHLKIFEYSLDMTLSIVSS